MRTIQRGAYPIVHNSIIPQQPAPLVDEQETVTYYGYANLGTLENAKEWLIVRVTVDGTITRTEYPDGKMEHNQAWADRADLNYAR